jgi:hypothetical protein
VEQDRDETKILVPLVSRPRRDLNKFPRFSIFCDETRPESPRKINKLTSPRPRLINNQNWSETETRPRVSVPFRDKRQQDYRSLLAPILIIGIVCLSLQKSKAWSHPKLLEIGKLIKGLITLINPKSKSLNLFNVMPALAGKKM